VRLCKKATNIIMGVPGVPAMLTDKFCGCIDLDQGLKFLSIIYAVFWVFYASVELITDWTYVDMLHILLPDEISHYVAAGWCVISAICYILVIIGIQINNRSLLLPGVLVSLGNIVICLLQALLDAITIIGIFGAIGGAIYAVFLAYYTVCLKALYDKMGDSAPPPAPMECQEQQFDQV